MTYTPTYKVPEVVRMRREGLTYRQIGEHFRISSSRVGHIIKAAYKHDREAVRDDTRLELRASGGLTKKGLPQNLWVCMFAGFCQTGLLAVGLRELAA